MHDVISTKVYYTTASLAPFSAAGNSYVAGRGWNSAMPGGRIMCVQHRGLNTHHTSCLRTYLAAQSGVIVFPSLLDPRGLTATHVAEVPFITTHVGMSMYECALALEAYFGLCQFCPDCQ